jgi:hypothetical protein
VSFAGRRVERRRKIDKAGASYTTVQDVAWLSRLLRACETALARAENPEFPADPGFIEDLRRYTAGVEAQLEAARRTDRYERRPREHGPRRSGARVRGVS